MPDFIPETCEGVLATRRSRELQQQETNILSKAGQNILDDYKANCPMPVELFEMGLNQNYYHYTLYYHDPAGRLIQTVPPKGVDVDDAHTRADVPDHTYRTAYSHDGLSSLRTTQTPDAGEVRMHYDALKRMRFTQTEQDRANGVYRYICYDALSRPVESGVNVLGSDVLANHLEDPQWPSNAGCSGCTERAFTVYSTPSSAHSFDQFFLENRVSYLWTEEGTDKYYTLFSYDVMGNVTDVLQDIAGLGQVHMHYDYDLYSGKVHHVSVNEGYADQFFFRFTYDEDGRLVQAYSSTDDQIWHRDQRAEFYAHGPLRRKEFGHYGVQGLDLTYSLQGKLVGMNVPMLDENDPGEDGFSGAHQAFAQDLFGMQLAYFKGDFGRTGSVFSDDAATYLAGANLHDGKVSSW
ncbi:MAG: hypothetical protein AAF570_26210, partial [Bacteroidota bacterium]